MRSTFVPVSPQYRRLGSALRVLRSATLPVLAVLAAAAAVIPPARGEVPRSRDILIVDSEAQYAGEARGSVFILKYDGFRLKLASSSSGMVDPVAVAETPARNLYVVDANADPLELGGGFGTIWETNPEIPASSAALAAASALFRNPADLLTEQDGRILLVDRDADPAGWGEENGAVFRIDPASNSVDVLAAPSTFVEPRCLAWDRDGNVLVLDREANPLNITTSAGAIFRLNRSTGAVTVLSVLTRPTFQSPSAVAVIPSGENAGDLIVVDKDADPEDRGTRPGAVFRIPRQGGAPVVFSAHPEFAEPIDVLVGVERHVVVLDSQTNPNGYNNARGAVYRFDLDTGALIHRNAEPVFRKLEGLYELTGPEIENSVVVVKDENQGLAQPGDLFTVSVNLVNSGTHPAEEIVLEDDLLDPWTYIAGSDSLGSGTASYDPIARKLRWQGSLGVGEETALRYRIRLSNSAAGGSFYDQSLTVYLGDAAFVFPNRIQVRTEFAPGVELFVDTDRVENLDLGYLYEVNPDSMMPTILWSGDPLKRPSDAEFLEDGSLAILDEGRPRPGSDTLGFVARFEPSEDRMSVVAYLTREDGFVAPSGIVVGRDGSIIVVDRDANPEGFPPPGDTPGPGAIFRLDWRTGEISPLLSDERWKEPLDGDLDRGGNLVLVDPGPQIGTPRPVIWTVPKGGGAPVERLLNTGIMQFPTGLAVNSQNEIYLADAVRKIIVLLRTGGYSIASNDDRLAVPADVAIRPDGKVLIADREADPRNFGQGDHGAVFMLTPGVSGLQVAAAVFQLTKPDGVCSLVRPAFGASRIALDPAGGSAPQPGDTLSFKASVINRGFLGTDNALAQVQLTSSLDLLDAVEVPGLELDHDLNIVTWTGRSAVGDTLEIMVRAVVRLETPFGDPAGATLTVWGGFSPAVSEVGLPVQAPFTPSDLLLADAESDPNQTGADPGAVFRLREPGRAPGLVYTAAGLGGVSALEWTPSGELLLAVLNGQQAGAIYRFDTDGGALIGPLDIIPKSPVDLFYGPDGDLFIVDRDVQGPTQEARGALFRKAGGTGTLQLFAADSLFRGPTQGVFGPGGLIYLADAAADPEGLGGDRGAVFHLDPDDGSVVGWLQDSWLREPTGVLSFNDTTLVLTDQLGQDDGEPSATLFYYRPLSGTVIKMLTAATFREPWRSLLLPTGEILVVDQGTGGQVGNGSIVGFDPARSVLRFYARSDSFAKPMDLVQKPGPLVSFDQYAVIDLNGPPLHPADRVRVEALLVNRGPAVAPDVTWTDPVPGEATLLSETISASSGLLEITGDRGLFWTGDVAAGDSVRITYEAQLNPALSEGKLIEFQAEAVALVVGTLSRSVKVQTHVPLEAGHLYMLDASATPFGATGISRGALFKVDLTTGSVVTMITSDLFRRPQSLAFLDGTRPRFLILDELAYSGSGVRGVIFEFDPATRLVEVLGGHSTWLSPRKLIRWGETEALVLDTRADPFDLTPGQAGPGAIYRLDLATGVVTPAFSDTAFKTPTSIAALPGGRVAVCDEDAVPDGTVGGVGAVFSADLNSGHLRLFATSQLWRTPTSVASLPDGGLLLADRDDTPQSTGAVYRINPQGDVSVVSLSPFFRRIVEVQDDGNGSPLVSDLDADPFGIGGNPGAIFSYNPLVSGRSVPLSSSPLYVSPSGFAVFGQLTPAGILEAAAEGEEGGIRLRWRAPSEETGIRFLVYRRQASGPEDPGDPQPEGYDLANSGDEFLGPGPHEFLDAGVASGAWYVYLIAKVEVGGGVTYADPLLARAWGSQAVLRLLPPRPNPTAGASSIRFEIPSPSGQARIDLFDVSGRRVRTLHSGSIEPGMHTILWEGRDDSGRALGSGLYFLRLHHGGETRTARLVLLR